MRAFAVAWATGIGLLAVAFFLSAGRSRADIDKDVHKALSKIADALQKGDKATATKEAQALARKKVGELEELMNSFRPRRRKGLGVGSKPGVVVPDGIEQKLNGIARNGITPQELQKEGAALAEAAWMTAALAEVTKYMGPTKDRGKKTRARWLQYATGLSGGVRDLAAAAKKMDVKGVNAAVVAITNNCNTCHAVFR